jgi:hypothetical protein
MKLETTTDTSGSSAMDSLHVIKNRAAVAATTVHRTREGEGFREYVVANETSM